MCSTIVTQQKDSSQVLASLRTLIIMIEEPKVRQVSLQVLSNIVLNSKQELKSVLDTEGIFAALLSSCYRSTQVVRNEAIITMTNIIVCLCKEEEHHEQVKSLVLEFAL